MAQRKTPIRWIYEADLENYVQAAQSVMREAEDGSRFFYTKDVDDKLEINLWKPSPVWLEEELKERKAEFESMEKPSDEELLNMIKTEGGHPYFDLKTTIERLETELEKYK